MANGGDPVDSPTEGRHDAAAAPTLPADAASPSFIAPTRDVAATRMQKVPRLEPGDIIEGTYRVEEAIGAGGMGVVYRARDIKLDRPVALKLRARWNQSESFDRLLREAIAMARLSHPNVVTVHEVGNYGDHLVIAMEYVDGGTLGSWLGAAVRPAREVLDVLCRAGDGLAAAHRAGLVHRDFKPDNILIGKDGRVRVADFGLARPVTASEERAAAEPIGALDGRYTATGAHVGTPAYMAPEQLGGEVDARADQFSFCVVVWEALAGERPFVVATASRFLAEVKRGPAREPPHRLPRWLRRVLARGLALDPADRYPSMEALLAALRRGPVWRRRGVVLAAAAACAAALVGGRWLAAAPPCAGALQNLAGVWDGERKQAVRAAFLATGKTYAADVSDAVARALDAYAGAWTDMRTQACEATAVRHEQSDAMLDQRMACLDGRLADLRALTTVFAQGPDEDVLREGARAALALPDLAGCADAAALTAAAPPPTGAEARARVDSAQARLAHVEALFGTGKRKEAEALARATVDEAQRIGYAPLRAHAVYLLGRIQAVFGDEDAETTLYEATRLAAEAKDDARAAESWLSLLPIVARRKPEEAATVTRFAEAAVARAGGGEDLRARFLSSVGAVLHQQGKFAEARERYGEALAAYEKARGPDDVALAPTLSGLANSLDMLRQFDDAARYHERALALERHAYGPRDVEVAAALHAYGSSFAVQGKFAEGRDRFLEEIAIIEELFGPSHPTLVSALTNLAATLKGLHQLADAERAARRAVALGERAYAPEDPRTAKALGNLGAVLQDEGKFAEAAPLFLRVVAMQERALGRDHPDVAANVFNVGFGLEKLGKPAEARPYFERALAVFDKAYGRDAPLTAMAVYNLAEVLYQSADYRAALARFDDALVVFDKLEPGDPEIAGLLDRIARCQLALGARERAAAPLVRARAICAAAKCDPTELAEQAAIAAALRARR
jgi:tetratricopeptide (TPR) repeat protein/tRNA A-37 threonylcarbamoyl transferase component Bud32